MKRFLITYFIINAVALSQYVFAQAGSYAFAQLSLPPSAHVASLGGENVSLHEGDLNFALQNPALLTPAMHADIALNATPYISDVFFGSASGVYALSEKQTVGIGIRFIDYGNFTQANELGERLGTFSARDLAFHLMYAHLISPHITVGGTLKPIYSSYQNYTSFALAADLGANYFVEESNLSLGLVLKNIGFQLSGFLEDEDGDQVRENLPIELQAGISKRLAHAPFRISATLTNLQRFDMNYRNEARQARQVVREQEKLSFLDNCIRHVVLGVDFIPSDQFYLTAGYNFRRAKEMKVMDNKSFTGFSLGGGFTLYKFNLGFAYAQYHPKNSSVSFSVSKKLEFRSQKSEKANFRL